MNWRNKIESVKKRIVHFWGFISVTKKNKSSKNHQQNKVAFKCLAGIIQSDSNLWCIHLTHVFFHLNYSRSKRIGCLRLLCTMWFFLAPFHLLGPCYQLSKLNTLAFSYLNIFEWLCIIAFFFNLFINTSIWSWSNSSFDIILVWIMPIFVAIQLLVEVVLEVWLSTCISYPTLLDW